MTASDDIWPQLFENLKGALSKNKEHSGLITDVEEYMERLQLQQQRLESHLQASEAEIKSLKADQSKKSGVAARLSKNISLDTPEKGAYVPAPVKQSVEELSEQVAKLKNEKEEMVKQKVAFEKVYNGEIEKLIRFKQTIQQHTEALASKVQTEADNVRMERDELLFQNADDELNKAHLKTRLDEAVVQLHQLAELTEEQAKAIEWLKYHRMDEKENRPIILDASVTGTSENDGRSEAVSEVTGTKSHIYSRGSAGGSSSESTEGAYTESIPNKNMEASNNFAPVPDSPSSMNAEKTPNGSSVHSPKESLNPIAPNTLHESVQKAAGENNESLGEDMGGCKQIQAPSPDIDRPPECSSPKSRQIKRPEEKVG